VNSWRELNLAYASRQMLSPRRAWRMKARLTWLLRAKSRRGRWDWISPKAVAEYAGIISPAKTIVWNGPMGVFEKDAFASGTIEIAKAVANSKAVSIIGGGDSAAAVAKAGLRTGSPTYRPEGELRWNFLAGQTLPGVAALNDKA